MTRELRIEKIRQPDGILLPDGGKMVGDIARCCVKDEESGLFASTSFFLGFNYNLESEDYKNLIEVCYKTCEQSINKRKKQCPAAAQP